VGRVSNTPLAFTGGGSSVRQRGGGGVGHGE